ncbi:DMT family transporter [Aliikangiella maris]|uniref:DMT family transporter n=2 Tax=Aliikangiella maris TaxID=3162458 RepID=A0ABV2BZ74_9GAMM
MKFRDIIDLTLLAAIWGASFLFMRVAAPEFGAIPLIFTRILIAVLFLLPIVIYRKKQLIVTENIADFALLGLLNSAMPFTLLAYATLYLTAGFTSIINATTPIFATIIAVIWGRYQLTRMTTFGLIVGVSGVVMLVWGKVSFDLSDSSGAIIAGLLAAACYGMTANFAKQRLSHIHPLSLSFGSLLASTLLLMPLAIYFWPNQTPSLLSWINVIVLGIVCTGLAQIMYFRLLRRIGPTNSTTVTFLIPIFGVIWGAIFLAEILTLETLLASSVILLGTGFSTGILSFPRPLKK